MALLPIPLRVRETLRPHGRWILGFSLSINLLMLVSPVYMLQVYDRILTTGSIETLGWLTLLAAALLALYGVAEMTRRRLFTLAAGEIGEMVGPALFRRFADEGSPAHLQRDLADLSRVQGGLRSGSLAALFDLPFAPLYLGALFLVHPVLGMLAIAGAAILLVGAIYGQRQGHALSLRHDAAEAEVRNYAGGLERQRSAMLAMGMTGRTQDRLDARRRAALDASLDVSAVQGAATGFSRAVRQGLQILVLGLGAMYAVAGDVSAGAIVAGSILMGRLLMPIDQMVGSWPQLHAMREGWARIAPAVDGPPASEGAVLPRPTAEIELKDFAVAVGEQHVLLNPTSTRLPSGRMFGLVGANGSGKSTLLDTLAGYRAPHGGEVLLGGRSVHRWPSDDRGRHVGYLPQHVELLPGTIGENIARFETDADAEAIFSAARRAGAHEAILALPDGYDSLLGPGGVHLSAGQAQLVGLARAFYGNPPLLLLDEPSAHLDQRATVILIDALSSYRDAGRLVIASTHDPAFLARCDAMLVLAQRQLTKAKPTDILSPVAVPTRKEAVQ